jgi:hypothetical protein
MRGHRVTGFVLTRQNDSHTPLRPPRIAIPSTGLGHDQNPQAGLTRSKRRTEASHPGTNDNQIRTGFPTTPPDHSAPPGRPISIMR